MQTKNSGIVALRKLSYRTDLYNGLSQHVDLMTHIYISVVTHHILPLHKIKIQWIESNLMPTKCERMVYTPIL